MKKNISGKQSTPIKQVQFKGSATIDSDWLEQNSLIVLSLMMGLLIFYVFHSFLLMQNVFLFKDIGSDTLNIFYPHYAHLSDYIRSSGLPKWSFNNGLGQNILAFSFGDLSQIVLALFSKQEIPYVLAYLEAVKIFLAGLFFYFFLKALKLPAISAITGALLYAFSGYMMIGCTWFVFSYEGMCYALLLWSLEIFITQKKWKLLPLVICMFGAYDGFSIYTAALISIAYLGVRMIYLLQTFNKISTKILILGLFGILGAALASFFLFSNIEQILQSPRVGGNVSFTEKLSSISMFSIVSPVEIQTYILRSFGSDMAGVGDKFLGWNNYLEAPMSYCGLVCFLLIPQVFLLADNRRKILFGVLFAVCIIPIVFPYFRYLFWLFSGDYYRTFSLFESVVFILLTVYAMYLIEKRNQISLPLLIGSLIVCLTLLYFPFEISSRIVNHDLRIVVTVFLIAFSALLVVLKNNLFKNTGKILFLTLLFFELGYLSSYPLDKRQTVSVSELKQKTGYNDFTTDAIEYLKKNDQSFYRVVKDSSSSPAIKGSLNDAKVQDYYGTSYYNSFPQKSTVDFIEKMNVILPGHEYSTRWFTGLGNRIALQSITNVKYVVAKQNEPQPQAFVYDKVATIGDVNIYKFNLYLPFGFTYNQSIPYLKFKTLSNRCKKNTLLEAYVSEDENGNDGLSRFNFSDTSKEFTYAALLAEMDSLKRDSLNIKSHNQNNISGDINLHQKKMLYFSIPFDVGWSATVNGKQTELVKVNIGFMGLLLDKGNYHIELSYEPPMLFPGLIVSLIALLIFGLLIIAERKNWFVKKIPG